MKRVSCMFSRYMIDTCLFNINLQLCISQTYMSIGKLPQLSHSQERHWHDWNYLMWHRWENVCGEWCRYTISGAPWLVLRLTSNVVCAVCRSAEWLGLFLCVCKELTSSIPPQGHRINTRLTLFAADIWSVSVMLENTLLAQKPSPTGINMSLLAFIWSLFFQLLKDQAAKKTPFSKAFTFSSNC